MVITLYQQEIRWHKPEENRRRAEAALAAAPKSDIFVVPETFTTGFGEGMTDMAEATDGPTLQWARRMAAQYDRLFVGTWIVNEEGRCYNRMHWVRPDGSYGTYDKGHTFRVSGEYDVIARGTRREVFEWRGWKIKPVICYDLRFPKWLRNDNMDYDLLLVCANWPGSRHEAWTTLLKARAIENLCYTVGCNRCGVDGFGGSYSGNSTAIDYKGLPVAECTGEETLTVTLDKERLQTFRQRWPFYLDFD